MQKYVYTLFMFLGFPVQSQQFLETYIRDGIGA